MKKIFRIIPIMIVILSLFLVACNSEKTEGSNVNSSDQVIAVNPEESEDVDKSQTAVDNSEEKDLKSQIDELKKENADLSEKVKNLNPSTQQQNILYKSLEVMEAIKAKDFQELSNHIHPSKGVKFSPYFFVDPPNHQVLTSQEIANLSQDNTLYNWGTFDGTGDPIDLDFNNYYDRFIYDEDYLNAHMIGINTPIGMGNIMDNVSIEYPDGEYVEYHFTGFDPQYDGMDWRSLRLVFEQSGGIWYLVGIVHGEWTT